MLNKSLIIVICACILVGCTGREEPSPSPQELLVVGVDPDYAPFEFVDSATGAVAGFDIDLMQAIGRYNRWQVEFREVTFDQLLPSVRAGEIGAAMSAISITPERQALVAFSDPYYLTGQSLVVAEDDSSITAPDDLRGQRVGVQQGTTAEQLAKRIDGALVFRYGDIEEAFRRLAEGDLDAVINDCPSTRTWLQAHRGFRVADPHLDAQYYGVALPEGNPHLLENVNTALAVLIGDGTYDSLHVNWFGYSWFEEPPCDSVSAP